MILGYYNKVPKRIMKYKYNPIGSTFKEGEDTLIVVEKKDFSCRGCYYSLFNSCIRHAHICGPTYRKDKKNVIFKKYEGT